MADIMNTTVYTKKAVLDFQRFDARMFKSVAWGTHAVFFMLFAIALAAAVYSVTAGGYILFAMSIACMAWLGRRYYFLYIAPARKFDSSSFINLRHEYRFRDSGVTMSINGHEQSFDYDKLLCAYETNDCFYLYSNKALGLIVDKAGFDKDGSNKLGALLSERLGNKFKIISK